MVFILRSSCLGKTALDQPKLQPNPIWCESVVDLSLGEGGAGAPGPGAHGAGEGNDETHLLKRQEVLAHQPVLPVRLRNLAWRCGRTCQWAGRVQRAGTRAAEYQPGPWAERGLGAPGCVDAAGTNILAVDDT